MNRHDWRYGDHHAVPDPYGDCQDPEGQLTFLLRRWFKGLLDRLRRSVVR